MTVVVGTHADAHEWFFDLCEANVPKPGHYRRSCTVPRAARIFIGPGDFARTKSALERLWKHSTWNLWLDGRAIDLRAFGTSDRLLVDFPPARGKNALLREWNVILTGLTRGKHTLRYTDRIAASSPYEAPGTYDATWTFAVP